VCGRASRPHTVFYSIAEVIDILSENFDLTLAKYKPQVALSTVTPISEPQPSLAELWEKYTEFKTPSLSPSIIAKDYVRIENCINLLPAKFPRDAIAIRDWLIANKTPDATKRVLTQLSACCDWATKSQLIADNPFEDMAADIRVPKGYDEDTDINPFSVGERDRIIAAFKGDCYYRYYAPLIEFLFLTGCRPSEAIALHPVLETAITTPDGKVKMLDAKDVAKLVGTSPKMIYEHYAEHARELFVPDI
jgi:integrase